CQGHHTSQHKSPTLNRRWREGRTRTE
ncbi:hypothetical protein C367_02617, partial [Cryptococcus neoformans Ze90-1]